jgi:hypothetical protein
VWLSRLVLARLLASRPFGWLRRSQKGFVRLLDRLQRNKRRSKEETKKIDAIVERLRDYLRLNYISYAEAAKRIGVRDHSLSSWFTGKTRPEEPDRITAFLHSMRRQPHFILGAGHPAPKDLPFDGDGKSNQASVSNGRAFLSGNSWSR